MSKRFTQLLTVAAALAITGIAGASTRAEGDVPRTTVKYGDLALNTKAGVAKLHQRIHAAAQLVCSGIDSRVIGLREQYDTCVSAAVNRSVADVANANLTEFHRTGRKASLLASN